MSAAWAPLAAVFFRPTALARWLLLAGVALAVVEKTPRSAEEAAVTQAASRGRSLVRKQQGSTEGLLSTGGDASYSVVAGWEADRPPVSLVEQSSRSSEGTDSVAKALAAINASNAQRLLEKETKTQELSSSQLRQALSACLWSECIFTGKVHCFAGTQACTNVNAFGMDQDISSLLTGEGYKVKLYASENCGGNWIWLARYAAGIHAIECLDTYSFKGMSWDNQIRSLKVCLKDSSDC
eukprot:TRINITY_DN106545_c0_g1_i1.p1 TRINITY_DN106545_c0_g1~~TRINITY_DN106545_c0_g1_i1.p1  ORF type:complete len:239 (+),score=63.13 TRINITY_DN106545_c0_g1_i1:95-811(+)